MLSVNLVAVSDIWPAIFESRRPQDDRAELWFAVAIDSDTLTRSDVLSGTVAAAAAAAPAVDAFIPAVSL